MTPDAAYHAGYDARWQYVGLSSCPFPEYSAESYAWIAGWHHADAVVKGLKNFNNPTPDAGCCD